MWRFVVRPFLFLFDAEQVHHRTMVLFAWLMRFALMRRLVRRLAHVNDSALKTRVHCLELASPVGLAAGFDKDARWTVALSTLGFGFLEVGTLTAHAQPGNPRPRLFRLPADKAVLNRFGFNNGGSSDAEERLRAYGCRIPVGVNIGRSKVTPNEEAVDDYLMSLERLQPHAWYVVVNVSSPNTAGLRDLQAEEPLRRLLAALVARNRELAEERGRRVPPLFVKIAPDMDDEQLRMIVELVEELGVDGIVATNTTVSREGLKTAPEKVEALGAGGVSGAPLTERSRAMVRRIYELSAGRVPIIGVGGIMNADDAIAMLEAGASAVQIYTGFIYGGPFVVRRINRGIVRELQRRGLKNVAELRPAL